MNNKKIFYNTSELIELETSEKWQEELEIAYFLWQKDNKNEQVFLKASAVVYYALAFWDCCNLSETCSKDRFECVFREVWETFLHHYRKSHFSRLIFAEILIIQPVIFHTMQLLSWEDAEQFGLTLLEEALQDSPMDPLVIVASSMRESSRNRKRFIKDNLSTIESHFNRASEIDNYFANFFIS